MVYYTVKFYPPSKTRRPFLMILLVRGITTAASDVGVMSDMPDIGT